MDIPEKLLEEIKSHFKDWYPREGCGVLAVRKGKLQWFPCDNVADSGDDFIIDALEYVRIQRMADVIGIVHSHPNASSAPSDMDKCHCTAMSVPYYIFSYPSMEMTVLKPREKNQELIGREYEFGVTDCFEAVRDYYIQEMDLRLPRRPIYEDNWWDKGLDYLNEESINAWGFRRIPRQQARKGDLMVFAVGTDINNHCAVYLGEEVIFHHAAHRLSCRESLFPLWAKYLTEVYRYEKNDIFPRKSKR